MVCPCEYASAAGDNIVILIVAQLDSSSALANHVVEWLTDSESYEGKVAALEKLAGKVAQPGSASRAAKVILEIAANGLHPSNDEKKIPVQHTEQAA